ncbi:MAG TPA: hypothetical protein VFI13_08960 [Gemmatimonadales bacterium]|nr:hypothetical protein [Gemmatimonadales bacterium]
MRARFLAAAAALVTVTLPLSAQRLSITPFVGEMVPLNNILTDTTGGSGSYYRLTPHTVYGLRLAKQMSPSFGLQFQGGTGKGGFEAVAGATPITLTSTVWFADLRGRLRLLGNNDANLGLLVGAGWTQYKMGLFDAAHVLDSGTKLAGRVTGIVGFGFKGHLTGNASFTADLTDRIHEQPMEAAFLSSSVITPTQHDLSTSFGLNFPLGR